MRQTLEQYSFLVNFIGRSLGPSYEVVLFDAQNDFEIVAISHAEISGRKIGDKASERLRNYLKNGLKDKNYLINISVNINSKVLRSSVLLLYSPKQKLDAILEINFDDSKFKALHRELLDLIHPLEYVLKTTSRLDLTDVSLDTKKNEQYDNYLPYQYLAEDERSINNIFEQIMLKNIRSKYSTLISKLKYNGSLTPKERQQLVKLLKKNDFFRLKGSILFCAEKMSCSVPTIYRYLNKIK